MGSPAYEFDTLIYHHGVDINASSIFTFPAGSHLYEIMYYVRSGHMFVKFTDGSSFQMIATDTQFFYRSLDGIPIRYGDEHWQETFSAKEVKSIALTEGAIAQLTYFTLTPLMAVDAAEADENQS